MQAQKRRAVRFRFRTYVRMLKIDIAVVRKKSPCKCGLARLSRPLYGKNRKLCRKCPCVRSDVSWYAFMSDMIPNPWDKRKCNFQSAQNSTDSRAVYLPISPLCSPQWQKRRPALSIFSISSFALTKSQANLWNARSRYAGRGAFAGIGTVVLLIIALLHAPIGQPAFQRVRGMFTQNHSLQSMSKRVPIRFEADISLKMPIAFRTKCPLSRIMQLSRNFPQSVARTPSFLLVWRKGTTGRAMDALH